MTNAPWIAIALGVVGVALAVAIVERSATAPQAATARPPSVMTDRTPWHYRFATTPGPETDLAGIIDQLEARVNELPGSAPDLADLADHYYRRALGEGDLADFERSEAAARSSLAIMPFPNPAKLTLAKLANAQHRFRDAISIGGELLAHRPTAGTSIVIATAHLALGELPEAAAACDAAIRIAPSTSGYQMRALVAQARGRDAEAAADFARAAAVEEPGEPREAARLRTLWGRFLLRRGELAGAAQLLDEALRIVPDDPFARAQRAEVALRTGRLPEARVMFEQAFAASRQVRYLIDLARAQELAGDRPAAAVSRTQVERMVRAELRDHGFGHQLDLVEILVDRGAPRDLEEAIRLGREELARRPSADTRFQLARALGRAGYHDDAVIQIRAALATGARDARMFELAARLLRSETYAREAAALDPGDSGWRGLGL